VRIRSADHETLAVTVEMVDQRKVRHRAVEVLDGVGRIGSRKPCALSSEDGPAKSLEAIRFAHRRRHVLQAPIRGERLRRHGELGQAAASYKQGTARSHSRCETALALM
jgi:hypothetical protein